MRVTANMTAELSVYNIQQGRSRIDKITEKLTTYQMINRPSDDPVSSGTLLDIKEKVTAYDQFNVNITKCKSWLEVTTNGLTGISDILDAARNLVSGSSSLSIQDPTQRQVMHDQLIEIKKQLIEMGNVQYGDQYIFGGGNNLVPPFSQKSGTLTSGISGVTMATTDMAALKDGMSVSGIGIPAGTFIKNLDTTLGTFDLVNSSGTLIPATAGDGATASTLNFFSGDSTQREVEITTNTRQAFSTTGDRLLLGSGDSSLGGVASDPTYGSTNILQVMDELLAAVGDSDPANTGDAVAVSAAAKKLESASKQVNAAITINSSRILRVDNMTILNDINKSTLTTISTSIQNVDLAKYGMQLNAEQTAFQASLAATARISSMSLLDYL